MYYGSYADRMSGDDRLNESGDCVRSLPGVFALPLFA